MAGKTHGMSNTREHAIWRGIIQRCTNPNNTAFQYYGGRGIAVCDRWLNSFEAFYSDMGPRPSSDYSVERRDGTRGYGPDNCYWATAQQQSENRSNNWQVEVEGVMMTSVAAAKAVGIKSSTLSKRLRQGVPESELLKKERLDGKSPATYFEHEGRSLSAQAWAKEKGISARTVSDRIFKQGMSIAEALSKPVETTYSHDGKELTLAAWSRHSGIPESTLHHRLKSKKMSIAEALSQSEKKK